MGDIQLSDRESLPQWDEAEWKKWREHMTPDGRKLYLYLHTRILVGDESVEGRELADRFRWSQARLIRAIKLLEKTGWLDVLDTE